MKNVLPNSKMIAHSFEILWKILKRIEYKEKLITSTLNENWHSGLFSYVIIIFFHVLLKCVI